MGIFSTLFRKQNTQTPLEAFACLITPEQSQATYRSLKDKSLRLPAALSTRVLYVSHRFTSGLREVLVPSLKTGGTRNRFPYDAVAFEAAAFCYYWLMRGTLNAGDEKPEDEAYLKCLRASAHITSSLLESKTSFDLPAELLLKRSVAYSHDEKYKGAQPEEKFANFLISSLESGSPAVKSPAGASSGLPVQPAVSSYIPVFEAEYLVELKRFAEVMYQADRKGAL